MNLAKGNDWSNSDIPAAMECSIDMDGWPAWDGESRFSILKHT